MDQKRKRRLDEALDRLEGMIRDCERSQRLMLIWFRYIETIAAGAVARGSGDTTAPVVLAACRRGIMQGEQFGSRRVPS